MPYIRQNRPQSVLGQFWVHKNYDELSLNLDSSTIGSPSNKLRFSDVNTERSSMVVKGNMNLICNMNLISRRNYEVKAHWQQKKYVLYHSIWLE